MTASVDMLSTKRRSLEELEAAVQDGAIFLDKNRPIWAPKIDRPSLDMSRGDKCVLGQIEGSGCLAAFEREATALGLNFYGSDKRSVISLGFTMESSFDEFSILTELWKKEIAKRLGEDGN